MPGCESGQTIDIVKYYQANCGKRGRCKYQIVNPLESDCHKGFEEAPVPPGTNTVEVWGLKPCGITCCKKVNKVF